MYIAVDIGGSKTLSALFDNEGLLISENMVPTNPDYENFTQELLNTLEQLIGDNDIDAIAIAAPGLIDYETGHVRRFGNLGWQDVDIKDRLEDHFHLPTIIDNDANMGAVGEANVGAGQGHKTVLYVTLSTGIGTGITINGAIDPALAKSEGGMMHFRHDGKLVRWESFASGKAFLQRFGKLGKDDTNDDDWKTWAEDVSLGMGSLIAIIQPEVIVIGGSMGQHLAKYHNYLVEALQATREPTIDIPTILKAHDAEKAVIYGCYFAGKSHAEHL